jgi:hypothetical protein
MMRRLPIGAARDIHIGSEGVRSSRSDIQVSRPGRRCSTRLLGSAPCRAGSSANAPLCAVCHQGRPGQLPDGQRKHLPSRGEGGQGSLCRERIEDLSCSCRRVALLQRHWPNGLFSYRSIVRCPLSPQLEGLFKSSTAWESPRTTHPLARASAPLLSHGPLSPASSGIRAHPVGRLVSTRWQVRASWRYFAGRLAVRQPRAWCGSVALLDHGPLLNIGARPAIHPGDHATLLLERGEDLRVG